MAIPQPERHVLRPSDIAGRGFSLSRKGYDPQEVHQFLTEVGDYVNRLQGEVEWLRARSEHLERRSIAAQEAAYARLSRDFMDVVRRADEAVGRVRMQAETRAQSEMTIARRDAERIVNDARREAERILAEARLQAHEIEWKTAGPDARRLEDPGIEWTGQSDPSVDLPTLAVDISGIWEQEEELFGTVADPAPPTLFEEPPVQISRIPDAWTSNGHQPPSGAPREPQEPAADPDDLDLYLDVSIFDLFENPED